MLTEPETPKPATKPTGKAAEKAEEKPENEQAEKKPAKPRTKSTKVKKDTTAEPSTEENRRKMPELFSDRGVFLCLSDFSEK